jgi:hypothetical protein
MPDHHDRVGAAGIRKYDGVIVRNMVIPESPDEELRGERYTQEDIDWLHAGEYNSIFSRLPEGAVVQKVWTEKASVGSDGAHDYLKKGKQVAAFPIGEQNGTA